MELDKKLGPIWHVIVGEEFGFDMTYEAVSTCKKFDCIYLTTFYVQGAMTYVYYGSLALLMWKCGTQLMSEIKYKPLQEEEDILAKGKKRTNQGGGFKMY